MKNSSKTINWICGGIAAYFAGITIAGAIKRKREQESTDKKNQDKTYERLNPEDMVVAIKEDKIVDAVKGVGDDDLLPTVKEYSEFLDIAQNKFGIDRESARRKYGLYTIGQWKELLGIGKINPNRNGTRVIFRKFSDGEVIAIFPDITWSGWGDYTSYMHYGQHGPADYGITSITKPATPQEYAPLLRELRSIGYDDLIIAKRV